MTGLDYAVGAAVAVSVLWGARRGLVREVVSLIGWVVAFLAANLLAWPVSNVLPAALNGAELRFLAAFGIVFIVVLLIAAVAGFVFTRVVKDAGMRALDRTLGSLFGVARGLLVVLSLGMVAGLTAVPRLPVWRDSVTGEPIARTALALRSILPRDFGDRLRYD